MHHCTRLPVLAGRPAEAVRAGPGVRSRLPPLQTVGAGRGQSLRLWQGRHGQWCPGIQHTLKHDSLHYTTLQDALLTVLKHGGGMTKEEAAVRMTEFRKEGTYQEDIFTS